MFRFLCVGVFILGSLSLTSKAEQARSVFDLQKSDYSCKKEVSDWLNSEIKTKNLNWIRQFPKPNSTDTARAQIDYGKWLEFSIDNKKLPTISYFQEPDFTDYTWNEKCEKTSTTGKLNLFPEMNFKKIKSFSTQELKDLVNSGKKGVIYIYSPRMVYSMTEVAKIKNFLSQKGYKFTALLDPQTDPIIAEKSAQKLDLSFRGQRMTSVDLYMLNGLDHFPTYFVYGNKKLNPVKLVGIHDNQNLLENFESKLAELK